MSTQWLTHQGKRILYIDYSPCKTTDQMLETLNQAVAAYAQTPDKVLSISNFTNTRGSEAFMKRSQQLGNEIFKLKRERAAVIGITGLQKIFLNSYNRLTSGNLMVFDTLEEALEYLVK